VLTNPKSKTGAALFSKVSPLEIDFVAFHFVKKNPVCFQESFIFAEKLRRNKGLLSTSPNQMFFLTFFNKKKLFQTLLCCDQSERIDRQKILLSHIYTISLSQRGVNNGPNEIYINGEIGYKFIANVETGHSE